MTDHKLTDAEIDEVQEAAYRDLVAKGYNGGMGGLQWDRASARAIEAAATAPLLAHIESLKKIINDASESMVKLGSESSARIAELERQAQYHRWNIEEDGDDLLICHNHHEKGEKCEYIRYTPAAEPAMQLLSAQAQAQENHERAERLEAELAAAKVDAERWKTFLSTRPQATHEVINQAIDDAMRKGEPT